MSDMPLVCPFVLVFIFFGSCSGLRPESMSPVPSHGSTRNHVRSSHDVRSVLRHSVELVRLDLSKLQRAARPLLPARAEEDVLRRTATRERPGDGQVWRRDWPGGVVASPSFSSGLFRWSPSGPAQEQTNKARVTRSSEEELLEAKKMVDESKHRPNPPERPQVSVWTSPGLEALGTWNSLTWRKHRVAPEIHPPAVWG